MEETVAEREVVFLSEYLAGRHPMPSPQELAASTSRTSCSNVFCVGVWSNPSHFCSRCTKNGYFPRYEFLDPVPYGYEEKCLLEAIVDDLEDDTVRLVYADWLEERGRELQARFIRLQIEYANTVVGSRDAVRVGGQIADFMTEAVANRDCEWFERLVGHPTAPLGYTVEGWGVPVGVFPSVRWSRGFPVAVRYFPWSGEDMEYVRVYADSLGLKWKTWKEESTSIFEENWSLRPTIRR
jgi:uncharacterized protein (TIGR02996 family)